MANSEALIQQQIVMWYHNTFCLKHITPRSLIISIPNEGKHDLFRTGLYPGASDLIIWHRGPNCHFIEVKTATGTQSTKQKEFERHASEIGVSYHLVRSLEQFQALVAEIDRNFQIPPPGKLL